MENAGQWEQDLSFITQVVERNRSERLRSWSIWCVWALITFIGFALMDFGPHRTGCYWLIAGPLGGLFTWYRHRHTASAHGVRQGEGLRSLAHWLAMVAGQILLLSLCALPDQQKAVAAILVVALAYFYMGLYRARPFLWFALLLTIGAVAIRFSHFPYVWTCLGAGLAGAFLLTAALANRVPVPAAAA